MRGAEERIWSVLELNRTARTLLEAEFPELWVGGEVANWTRARSGHRYFTLKDDQAQLRCVMWKRDAERLPVDPEEGMQIRVFGGLTVYEVRGEYQFSVRRLEGEGAEGLWRLAFERLRSRLAEEGILDAARKRAIPRFPATVGIVTSSSGAALHDILTVIRRRAPWTRVVLRASRVQGEGAAAELAEALRTLAASGEVDVIIIGRGGGSIEDLWAFNEEPVARAIAASPVPVISAVGHEVDVTIADLVADLRAPTPSAAAEAAVPDRKAVQERLAGARPRLARALRRQTEHRRQRISEVRGRVIRGAQRLMEPHRRMLERHTDRSLRAARRLIQVRRERIGHLGARVDALSPLSTLKRGYAIPLSAEGRLLRRAMDFRQEPPFELRVVDGRIRCQVLEVREEER
ncbi:MAG: exodeoxyribonuclease VII large subunit [Gemmatimonadota bacterium]